MTNPQTDNFSHEGCNVEIETLFRFTVRRNGVTLHRDDGYDTIEACVASAEDFINDIEKPMAELSDLFVSLLRQALTPAEFALMQERNNYQDNPNICHSHDFLDANVIMAQAFEQITRREVDLQSETDLWLWKDAWAFAAPVIRVVPQGEKS